MNGDHEPLRNQQPPSAANASIVLYKGQIALRSSAQTTTCSGTAELRWLPSPGIRLTIDVPWPTLRQLTGPTIRVRLGDMKETPALVTSRSLGLAGQVKAFITSVEDTRPTTGLNAIRFWVVNFPDVVTRTLPATPGKPWTVGRKRTTEQNQHEGWTTQVAHLLDSDWAIAIVAPNHSRDTYANLKTVGGYAVTHIGQLVRRDGTRFTVKQAEPILSCVDQFLSFARGASCATPVRWGMAADRGVVWCRFSSPIVDPWKESALSWFDPIHGHLLTNTFEEFHRLHDHSALAEPFTLALYWYRRCATGSAGPEGSLVLGLTALELLSAMIIVERTARMSAKAHDRLTTRRKLQELLRALGIAPTIPARYRALAAFARKSVWSDACHALAELRHGFVHPKEARRRIVLRANFRVLHQAIWLTLWYQELAFLHLLRHKGQYFNRVTARSTGQLQSVPWAV